VENLVFEKRAANIPEFFPGNAPEFNTIVDEFSNTAPYFTQLASDNMQSQYYLRADRNLKRAIALDSNYIDAYILKILLNSILVQVNSTTEKAEKTKALSIVNDLISQNKEDLELQFLKANLLSAVGNNDQTLAILNSIISRSPEFYRAYDLLATVYKKQNKSNLVVQTYNKMKELVPVNELEINIAIIKYYLSNNKTNDALLLLKNMIRKYPYDEELHELLCGIYIGMKDTKAAQGELSFLLSSDSTNYRYYLMYAEIYKITGDQEKIKEYSSLGYEWLQQNLDENNENIPLVFEKASILQKNKDLKGAVEIYDNILKHFPSNYRALKEKARITVAMQKWQNAILLYNELLRHYTPEEEFYNNTAIAYIELGNFEEALNNFSNTLELNPSNVDALYNRSKLYEMLGDTQKAGKDLETMEQILKKKKSPGQDK
jgi:tetratricopeptide (TPR) repeat protein